MAACMQLIVNEDTSQRFDREKKELNDLRDEYGDREYAKAAHGFTRDNIVPTNDIFLQEFMFSMHVLAMKHEKNFFESTEGITYIGKFNY